MDATLCLHNTNIEKSRNPQQTFVFTEPVMKKK